MVADGAARAHVRLVEQSYLDGFLLRFDALVAHVNREHEHFSREAHAIRTAAVQLSPEPHKESRLTR